MINKCEFCSEDKNLNVLLCVKCRDFKWGCDPCFSREFSEFRGQSVSYSKSPCVKCRRKLRDVLIDTIIQHK